MWREEKTEARVEEGGDGDGGKRTDGRRGWGTAAAQEGRRRLAEGSEQTCEGGRGRGKNGILRWKVTGQAEGAGGGLRQTHGGRIPNRKHIFF